MKPSSRTQGDTRSNHLRAGAFNSAPQVAASRAMTCHRRKSTSPSVPTCNEIEQAELGVGRGHMNSH